MTDTDLMNAALAAEAAQSKEREARLRRMQEDDAKKAYEQLSSALPTLRLLPNHRFWLYGREWNALETGISADGSAAYALVDGSGWMVSDLAGLGRWINEQQRRSEQRSPKTLWDTLFS